MIKLRIVLAPDLGKIHELGGVCGAVRTTAAAPDEREFVRMVREGFGGSDASLDDRVRAARALAFCRTADGALVGIAGLKSPAGAYRREVFARAGVGGEAAAELELGWVYVVPRCRRRGIARSLCRRLLNEVPGQGVFATTRPGNAPMRQLLLDLGFREVGRPLRHPRRADQTLSLSVRPAQASQENERSRRG